ncbi:MAG: MerR family transcriptional regulator [Treponema sp.]|jgi:DNA-binding transcriptional MerR regulator|nr:MerR family transcriptional regulator [Treponema sp.]
MASYSIGDVEKLTGIKSHVLRYWEKEIPLLQPHKNNFGRREYSSRDIRIIFRLKYLLYVRRFTIQGARVQLLNELSEHQDVRAFIDELRSDLVELYFMLGKKEGDNE